MSGQTDLKELPAWQASYQRVAMSLASKSKDPKIDEQFAKMAEGSRAERLNKAGIAQALKKYDDAARLANLMLGDDPKDVSRWKSCSDAQVAAGRRASAGPRSTAPSPPTPPTRRPRR